jgi:hypothetical protein
VIADESKLIGVDIHVQKWINALKKWTEEDDTTVTIINFTVKNGTVLVLENTGVEVNNEVQQNVYKYICMYV